MNPDELVAQLEFFRDIGLESLSIAARPSVEKVVSPALPAPSKPPVEETIAPSRLTLESVRADLGECQRCKLAPKRTNIVFGSGSATAELVFVGEAPGFDEDQ